MLRWATTMRRMGRAQFGQGWPVRRKTRRWAWFAPAVPRVVSKVLNDVPWLAMPDSRASTMPCASALSLRGEMRSTGASGWMRALKSASSA